MKKFLLSALSFLWAIHVSYSATIVVSSASEIANSDPEPGDTLLMSEGLWEDQNIILDFDGTEENPITLLADGDGTVILTGSSTLEIAGSYTTIDGLTFKECASTEGVDLVRFRTSSSNLANNCRLTNCLFTDNNPSDLDVGYKWVSLYGSNNRVDHCWFELKEHRGTTLVVWLNEDDEPNYHRIDHNYFTRPELTTGNNEAETIRIGTSTTSLVNSSTTVEYNFFEECDGEIEVISNKSCYNIYRYNTFFENRAILTLRHGHFCTVFGNYFFGSNIDGSGGVRIIGIGHQVIGNYMQDINGSGNLRAPIVIMGGVDGLGIDDATNRYVAAEDNIVAFNTMVNCEGTNIYVGSDKTTDEEGYLAPSNNTIENNLFYGTNGDVFDFEFGEISNFSYSGNLYYGLTLGKGSTGFSNEDPDLVFGSETLEPARLSSSSPAIDAALSSIFSSSLFSYNEPTEDFDGEVRSGTLDVGADEYFTTDPSRSPIQKTEVGPCWLNPDACEGDVVVIDCNGDEGGTASYDNCGVCSGGETGITENSTCTQDCNDVWGGTASIDDCEVCSGGNTGIEINACLECNEPFATDVDDENIAANVFDNDISTRWSGFGEGTYLEVCLGDTMTINEFLIAFHNGTSRTTSFNIDISLDGVNWTRVIENGVSSGSSLELETFSITPADVWKVRYIGLGNSSNEWNSVTEFDWNGVLTSINSYKTSNLSFYPNPMNETLLIEGVSNNLNFEILDASANILIAGELDTNNNTINVSTLKPGVYYISLSDGTVHKLIK